MKCSNIRVVEGQLAFDCPHCGFSYDADDNLISQVWAGFNGAIPCQQEGCGKEILFPTLDESQSLMSGESMPTQEESAPAIPAEDDLPAEQSSPGAESIPEPAVDAEPAFAVKVAVAAVATEEAVVLPRANLAATVSAAPKPAAKADAISFGFRGAKNFDSLDKVAKRSVQLAVKTILRHDCRRDGLDVFDQTVTAFLQQVGTENVSGVHPVSYTDKDDKAQDFGVLIVYRIL